MAKVIDENVLVVANDVALELTGKRINCPQADDECRLAVIDFLNTCRTGGLVVLDAAGEVMALYRRRMSGSGQPGSGDAFFRYLMENQYNSTRVTIVELAHHSDRSFDQFPDNEKLARFDTADRIYVALASSVEGSRIINCVDSDYAEHQSALEEAGVHVEELCPHCVRVRLT